MKTRVCIGRCSLPHRGTDILPVMRVLTHIGRSPMQQAAASGSSVKMLLFMKTVVRCVDAGLSLAALARLGGVV